MFSCSDQIFEKQHEIFEKQHEGLNHLREK